MNKKTPGEIAYFAQVGHLETSKGQEIIPFSHHNENRREAWEKASEAVVLVSIQRLLLLAEELFPRTAMPKEFKGANSLTINPQGDITLTVWFANQSWFIIIPREDVLHTNYAAVVQILTEAKAKFAKEVTTAVHQNEA